MKKAVQDMKVKIEWIKKTQTKVKLEMKNLGTQTRTSRAILTSRIKDMKGRFSGIEDKVEEMDISVKENVR